MGMRLCVVVRVYVNIRCSVNNKIDKIINIRFLSILYVYNKRVNLLMIIK